MNAFKKIILILSVFCIALPVYGMSVPSLQSKCINTIGSNFDKYTPEEIAQLPEALRNALVHKALTETLGVIDCERQSYFGQKYAIGSRNRTGPVYAVAATSDNKIIAGTYDHVYVWDMNGNKLAVCKGHSKAIESVAVTHDNNIISGSFDKTIRVWDIDGNQRAVFEGHSDSVSAVAVSHDNKIISGSRDNTVRIWDIDGTKRAVCIGHTAPISAVAISHDNKIISASKDKTIRVWDMEGNQRAIFEGNDTSLIAVTPDNKIVVGAYRGNSMSVWDIDGNYQGKLFFKLHCRSDENMIVRFAVTDDNKMVLACADGSAYIYDMYCNQLAICHCGRSEDKDIRSIAVTHDNKVILGCLDHSGRVFNMNFLNRLEKINSQQALRILKFLRNPSLLRQNYHNYDNWKMIRKILNEPEINAEASMSDEVQEAISVPALSHVASAQTPSPASKKEFQRKVQTKSLNIEQKITLACVVGFAGCIAYKMFTSSSDN